MLQTPANKPLNVWLVDDDASIRWVLERALRQGGMAPTAFDHADSAIAALRRDRPDLFIYGRLSGEVSLRRCGRRRAARCRLRGARI